MVHDATEVTLGKTMETQVCIIGAGPAGLLIAAELSRLGTNVVLLESGAAANAEPAAHDIAQQLNDGVCTGDQYNGLRASRRRAVGGTTGLWNTPTTNGLGAKYVPLDAWDFEPRFGGTGWPFGFEELRPYLVRAQQACGLGEFSYEAEPWMNRSRLPLCMNNANVGTQVYQLGSRDSLIDPPLSIIRNSNNGTLCTSATVVRIAERDGHATLTVVSKEGVSWEVRAERVVLAAGAVENARLLLLAIAEGGIPPDASGCLGRGFMEHPRDRSMSLIPSDPTAYNALKFYDVNVAHSGTTVLGRFSLTGEAVRSRSLLNASATLLPIVQPARERVREVMTRRLGWSGFHRWLPAGGHGWSQHPAPERVYAGFTVLLNVEQSAWKDNAITLSPQRDRFGVPLPQLHWRWRDEDHARMRNVRDTFAAAFRKADVGALLVGGDALPDPNAHHHAGTTRMHADPHHGVVDADGRVHGTRTLFVAGASTFPSAGFANPTLTIAAMALRLADHLPATF